MQNSPPDDNVHGGEVEAPTWDHLAILWRHKWLLVFGACVGLALGYLYFSKQPEVFQSRALVKVVNPSNKNLPIEGVDLEYLGGTMADEIRVIRSEVVLQNAAELGQLAELGTFDGMKPAAIAAKLQKDLRVSLPDDDRSSSVLEIAYAGGDPDDAPKIVQAVIEAYSAFLRNQQIDIGQETLDLIREAKDEVLTELTELEDQYEAFRKEKTFIVRDGQHTSVHRANADRLLSERQQLMVRQTQLDGWIAASERALENGQTPEMVLLTLRRTATNAAGESLEVDAEEEEQPAERPRSRAREMYESTLFPLLVKEKELLDKYGSGHPQVKTLRLRIEMHREQIGRIAKAERLERQELEQQLAQARKDPATADEVVEAYLKSLEQELEAIDQQISVINDAYQKEREQAQLEGASEATAERFDREIARKQQMYDQIVARLDELNLTQEVGGRRVEPLNTPKRGYQVAPVLSRALAMGGFLGLLAATGLGYLLEWGDQTFHNAQEIAESVKTPVIAHIPAFRADSKTAIDGNLDPSLIVHHKKRGTESEAYRSIRTALYFSGGGKESKVIQVTSAVPGDGKSTIAANLAIAIAQSGKQVALVDCDFRRPRQHRLFNVETDRGVVSMVRGLADADGAPVGDLIGEAIIETDVPNLSLMVCGKRPADPAELLSSEGYERLLDELRTKFDMVVVDTPPLLAVTDPSNVAARVDGVLMVVRVRKNAKPQAARAAEMLRTLNANVLGVVVNGIGGRDTSGYGKYSRYKYYGANASQYYKYGYAYSYGNNYGVGDGYHYGSYYEELPAAEDEAPRDEEEEALVKS